MYRNWTEARRCRVIIWAALIAGCSSPDRAEPIERTTSAVYSITPPPAATKWAVILCNALDEQPGDKAFYQREFTCDGSGTICDYWKSQSKGNTQFQFDVLGSYQIQSFLVPGGRFNMPVPATSANLLAHATSPGGGGYGFLTEQCYQAAGFPGGYYNYITIYSGTPYHHYLLGNVTRGGPMVADAFSCPNGVEHEMGHCMTLDHSYNDKNALFCGKILGEYGDNWDIMSFNCDVAQFRGSYAFPAFDSSSDICTLADGQGPGMNMWNRWQFHWLPSVTSQNVPNANPFTAAKQMFWPAPRGGNTIGMDFTLVERDSPRGQGPMVLYIPASPTMMYTVEYIAPDGYLPDGWDFGASSPGDAQGNAFLVLIHKIVYGDQHPYLVKTIANGIQTAPNMPFVDSATGITIVANAFNVFTASITVNVDSSVNQLWTGSTTSPRVIDMGAEWEDVNVPLGEADATNIYSPYSLAPMPAGNEGSTTLYSCRTWYYGVQLGKAWPGRNGCSFPWGGAEHWSPNYQVLARAGNNPQWVSASNGTYPARALIGGYENGAGLLVCRAWINDGYAPGKFVGGYCDVSWGGQENFFSSYQILVPG